MTHGDMVYIHVIQQATAIVASGARVLRLYVATTQHASRVAFSTLHTRNKGMVLVRWTYRVVLITLVAGM